MRIFNYLFPTTGVYFLLLAIYHLLALADLVLPLADLWRSTGVLGYAASIAIYLIILGTLRGLATTRNWNHQLPWVLELGVRRGLRIGGVPIYDYAMLMGCGLLALVVWRYNPALLVPTLYLVGPLGVSLLIGLLTSRPRDPEVIIEADELYLSQLAKQPHPTTNDLTLANGLQQGDNPKWTFATRVRLPE